MTMVNPSEVDKWLPQHGADLMTQGEIIRHLAWVKVSTHKPNREIGLPLTLTEERTRELLTGNKKKLQYPYLLRITSAAKRMYPAGVPMLKEYHVAGPTAEEALDIAFGPRSVPAQQQTLIPSPEPIVVAEGSTATGEPFIAGDIDFDPNAEDNSHEEYRAYIQRLEVNLNQREQQQRTLNRVIGELKEDLVQAKLSIRDISSMNAANDKRLTEANEAIKQLTEDLLEAQKCIEEYSEAFAAIRSAVGGVTSDE